ncbi:hypothetical protein TSMEX_007880 [Taenia solium]|eukprot:TsM_000865200 transcript=TsM_000865200 gene=TsM_000865200
MAALQQKYDCEEPMNIYSTQEVSVICNTLIKLRKQHSLAEMREWVANTTIEQKLIDGVSHYQDLWNPDSIPYCPSDQSLDSYVKIRPSNWTHNCNFDQLKSAIGKAVGIPSIFWSTHESGTRDPSNQDSWTPISDLMNSAARDLSEDALVELDGEFYQSQPESTLITFDLPKML